MFFTQDDYKKIQQWLIKNSVKDTEFNEANIPFNGEETITIVQGNQNKKVFLKDLIAQVFNLGISDFVNITDKYDAPNISLEEAIRLIPSRARKEGQVITFLDREDHWHIYQFKGVLNQWNVLDTWEDLFDWEKLIIDSILPDEEDLTKSLPDTNGNSYLSLKDREYNPEDFSGLGRVILRKNIVEIEDPIYGKVKKNILTQEMINKENTIYEIRYDFEIDSNFTMPKNSRFLLVGGKVMIGNDIVIASNEVRASEIGMVQNNMFFAVKNASLLAYYSNLGIHIIVDGIYYIESEVDSPIALTNDVIWTGDGTLIRTRTYGSVFSINVPIKIYLDGLTFDGTFDVSETTRSIIFKVGSIVYSKGVYVKNCTIRKVRIYYHSGQDVDQQSVLDGDYEVIFENNTITDIANAVCIITDCRCTLLKITNNIFRKIHNYIFDASVTNSYMELPFGRLTTAIIDNNHWDNSELIIENTTSTYNCMIILEGEVCTFTNNYVKDFIVLGGERNCVTYIAYLSTRICEIVNNTFINVVGFNNPEYSDIFKCKEGAGIGAGLSERKIENNTYILTKACVEEFGDVENPPRKALINLQSSIDRISISNNLIDAYCTFAFGGGSIVEYKNYELKNNRIVCYSLFNSNIMRYDPASTNAANIVIEGNEVLAETFSDYRRTLFYSNIPDGYSISLKNNNFRGYELGFSTDSTSKLKEFTGRLSILAIEEGSTLARHYAALKEDIIYDMPFVGEAKTLRLYSVKDSRFFFESLNGLTIELNDFKTEYATSSILGTLIIRIKHTNHYATGVVHLKENIVEVYDGQGNLKTINRTTSHSRISIPIKDKSGMTLVSLDVRYSSVWVLNFLKTSANKNVEIEIKVVEGQYIFPNLQDEYLGTTLSSVDSMSQASKGIPMMYSGEIVFFDGSKARTANGHSVAAKKGTTAKRPTYLDNANDVGYVYFDSTLGKPIYWTGTKWVDATGADV